MNHKNELLSEMVLCEFNKACTKLTFQYRVCFPVSDKQCLSSHKPQAWPAYLCYHKSTLTKAFLKSLGSIPGSTSCNNGRTWLRPAGYDSSGLTSALATDVTQFKVAVNWWGSVRVPNATYNLWQESTHLDVIGLYWRILKTEIGSKAKQS